MDLKNKENISRISPLCTKGLNYHHRWLRNRELGNRPAPGSDDFILREMYSTIRPISQWESFMSSKAAVPGGIFNLEFSPDGVLVVAACEKRSVLLFDANTQKYIHSVDNAHDDCVNCVRFLDTRVFATCSDDSTVALWDTRNLKSKIRVLYGHSNWVKNVEFSKNDKLLVTSGFDGSIFTWDINSYTERGLLYKKAFHTNGLMRMRLHPDASKMLICTTSGYIMIVHDLNLETLPADLYGFKPSVYRLMQVSSTTIPIAAKFTYLFDPHRKRNRVELISDFPRGDEAEVISSLQIHPQGWCAVSRNITSDERSEWTCVHDIQEQSIGDGVVESYVDYSTTEEPCPSHSHSSRVEDVGTSRPHHGGGSSTGAENATEDPVSTLSTDIWEALMSIQESRDRSGTGGILLGIRPIANNLMTNGVRIVRISSGIEDLYEEEVNSSDANASNDGLDSPQASSTYDGSFSEIESPSASSFPAERMEITSSSSGSSDTLPSSSQLRAPIGSRETRIIIISPRNPAANSQQRVPSKSRDANQMSLSHRIHQNRARLTHYVEETNAGKGYIKELSFSQDGRIICSPFSYGVRLLAFNERCSELSACVPSKTPVPMYEIGTCTAHNDIVLCTKFSPRHCMLVSGCHSGKIIWYQPYL